MTEELTPILSMLVYAVCGIGIVMGIIFRFKRSKSDDTSNHV